MNYFPVVVQAIPGKGHTVYAYFSDGSVRLADIEPAIQKGGVFAPLLDDIFFRSRLTVINGAVAWDLTGTRDESQCIDLDPIEMYRSSRIVPNPLEEKTVWSEGIEARGVSKRIGITKGKMPVMGTLEDFNSIDVTYDFFDDDL